MLNNTGIKTETGVSVKQILANVDLQASFGVVVNNTNIVADANGKKIIKAGTPLTGDLESRGTAFTKATTSNSAVGFFTVQITTAFVAADTITIDGTTYTAASTEDVAEKKFAVGSSIADQVTSLLKMVTTTKYNVAAVTEATDKIGFTQKVIDTSDTTGPTITETGTGAVGSVTKVTDPAVGTSNAKGLALHDVDVTDGNNNATILTFGFVNTDRIDSSVTIDTATKTALSGKIQFVK